MSKLPHRYLRIATLFLFCVLLPGPALSQDGPTVLEWYLLPDYCKALLSGFHYNRAGLWNLPIDEGEVQKWNKRIAGNGPGYWHACMAIVKLQRKPPQFEWALGEMMYWRKRNSRASALWPEFSIYYARILEGLRRYQDAVDTLTELARDFPQAGEVWLALGQTYQRAGKLDEAIAAMEEGMKRTGKAGPFLFWLARYWYDKGDIAKATELTAQAEKAGMKMDSLRAKLGKPAATPTAPAPATPPLTGSIPVPAER